MAFDASKINIGNIVNKVESSIGARKAKYSEEFSAMKDILFKYAEDNKGEFKMAKLRHIASEILVEFGSIKEAYISKATTINGKTNNIKEYAVTGEQLRSLFKRNNKIDLLPEKQTRSWTQKLAKNKKRPRKGSNIDYYTPYKHKTSSGFRTHKNYSASKNYLLVEESSTKVRLRFEEWSIKISKLIIDYDYKDGLLFDTEEPFNDIVINYRSGLDIEDFITIIARPLKQMELSIKQFNTLGNNGTDTTTSMDDMKEHWLDTSSSIDNTILDVSNLNF